MAEANEPEIRLASTEQEIAAVRGLWLEYWESLNLPPEFQVFSVEMGTLPGSYAAPQGRLLVAFKDRHLAGAGAFRRLNEQSCEAKRLYVRPQYRGLGIASALLGRLIQEARNAGYSKMYGDTLPSMESALRLYRKVGFEEVAAYSATPTAGAIFLCLTL